MIPSHFMPIFADASSSKILIMMIVSGVGSTLLVFGVLVFFDAQAQTAVGRR